MGGTCKVKLINTAVHIPVNGCQKKINSMEKFIKQHPQVLRELKNTLNGHSEHMAKKHDDKSATSQALRQKANTLYKRKQFDKARDIYSQSIKAAAYGSEMMLLALGNRSAVNFELKLYQLCLRDIDIILSFDEAPLSLLSKVLVRKLRCTEYIGTSVQNKKVIEDVATVIQQKGIELSETDRLYVTTREKFTCSGKQVFDQGCIEVSDKGNMGSMKIPVHKSDHKAITGASCVIEMKRSNEKGRFLEVTETVDAGTVLISEEPYVTVLLPDYWSTHCYHCLHHCQATPFYCQGNHCEVQYCSRTCQLESWETSHKYECKTLSVIVNTGIGHLAHKITTYTGLQTLLNHRAALTDRTLVRDDLVDRYDEVYNLVTNSQNIQPEDLISFQKAALLLTLCLMDTEYFSAISGSPTLEHEDVLYVCGLILCHIQQLICNAHAITMIDTTHDKADIKELVYSETQEKLATAIYPTASLMNHSCKPNIIVSFKGLQLIVKNSVDLKTGDEVFNCYGPHYQKMERSDRQKSLRSQYYFTCDCEACKLESDKAPTRKALCCLSCKGRAHLISATQAQCELCSQEYDCSEQTETLLTSLQSLETLNNLKPKSGVKLLRGAINNLTGVVHEHSMDLANLYDKEASLHASLDDMNSCAQCLMKSVTILEHIYPSMSIELGHEYHKISEVYCNIQDYKTAFSFASKARKIFCKQYYDSHPLVQEVDVLCQQILSVDLGK